MINNTQKKWPKKLPEFTPEQKRIRSEFMECWHEVLPAKYGIVEKFNHGFPVQERDNTPKMNTGNWVRFRRTYQLRKLI